LMILDRPLKIDRST